MRFLKTTLFLVTMMIFSVPVKKAERYFYENPFDSAKVLAILIDSEEVAVGDRAHNATFCDNHHQYICFSSKPLSFAVPRVPNYRFDTWEWNGMKYKLVKTEAVSLMGHEYSIERIESVQQGMLFKFLYSYQVGLIGFQASKGNLSGTFLMTGNQGFGSTQ
jgi:hypothetical protein